MGRVMLIVVEGVLEAPAARRLLDAAGWDHTGVEPLVQGGSVAFWENAPRYNEAAKHVGPVLGLTDLDTHPCASGLIGERLRAACHPSFLLRIAVRELESWLLADAPAWARYLGVSEALVPSRPDVLEDPKQSLVNLVRRSRKRGIREDIVPEAGRPGPVGPGYTPRMSEFIARHWVPERAAQRSPSLARALSALERAKAASARG